jgi:integrase
MCRAKWREDQERDPGEDDLVFIGRGGAPLNYDWIDDQFRGVALKLHKEGLVVNGNPKSWHTHALRHSFETEASHAGVKAEIRDYFLGHVGGIRWVYNHRDEVHPEDLVKEYLRIEPYVSLEQTQTAVRKEYEDREMILIKRLAALEERVSQWAEEGGGASSAP